MTLSIKKYVTPDHMDIKDSKKSDLNPTTLETFIYINKNQGKLLFTSLLYHRGAHVIIQKRCLIEVTEVFIESNMIFKTNTGIFTTTEYIYLTGIQLPEISDKVKVRKVKAYLFYAPEMKCHITSRRCFFNEVKINVLSSASKC